MGQIPNQTESIEIIKKEIKYYDGREGGKVEIVLQNKVQGQKKGIGAKILFVLRGNRLRKPWGAKTSG